MAKSQVLVVVGIILAGGVYLGLSRGPADAADPAPLADHDERQGQLDRQDMESAGDGEGVMALSTLGETAAVLPAEETSGMDSTARGQRSAQVTALLNREHYSLRESLSIAMSCVADILEAEGSMIHLEPGSKWSTRDFLSINELPIFRGSNAGQRLFLAERDRFPLFFAVVDRSRGVVPGLGPSFKSAPGKEPVLSPAEKAWLLQLAQQADLASTK